jgi:hypothetical protein
MSDQIRIIPHSSEGIPDAGSFEVVWPGGKRYFFGDDLPGRQHLNRQVALEQARELTRKTARIDSKSRQPIVVELWNA